MGGVRLSLMKPDAFLEVRLRGCGRKMGILRTNQAKIYSDDRIALKIQMERCRRVIILSFGFLEIILNIISIH